MEQDRYRQIYREQAEMEGGLVLGGARKGQKCAGRGPKIHKTGRLAGRPYKGCVKYVMASELPPKIPRQQSAEQKRYHDFVKREWSYLRRQYPDQKFYPQEVIREIANNWQDETSFAAVGVTNRIFDSTPYKLPTRTLRHPRTKRAPRGSRLARMPEPVPYYLA